VTYLFSAAAADDDDNDDVDDDRYSGEVKVIMDPQKHYSQFPKIFAHNARTDKTSAALSAITHVEDVIKYIRRSNLSSVEHSTVKIHDRNVVIARTVAILHVDNIFNTVWCFQLGPIVLRFGDLPWRTV